MDSPTREFRRLTIRGNMSATRGRRQQASHEESQSPSDDSGPMENSSEENGSGEFEEESAESSTLQARSGITYDLADLDYDCEAKAVVGLTGQFDVVECVTTRGGYSFQLSDHPRVHIGPDQHSCTCSSFQRQPDTACQHIFWLVDQLHGCLPQPSAENVPISSDGRSPELPRIQQLLESNIETVADQLDYQYRRDETEGGMSRAQKARDIISAFEAVTLPEDFRLDLVDSTEQRSTPEQCVVQGDLQATTLRLAIHDDNVYTSLCKAMPPGATAAIYFDKILEKSRKLLADFDRYCQTGQLPADGANVQVNHVVDTLRQDVNRIHTNIAARAPYGVEGAAKVLVTLLEDVSNRNKDALDGNRWGAATFQGEDEDQRNLYHQLIGKEDESEEFAFLDALELLSGADLHQFAPRLRALLHKNEVFPAPRPFIVRLAAVVRVAESGAPGAGQKRPAGSASGGNSKRTR